MLAHLSRVKNGYFFLFLVTLPGLFSLSFVPLFLKNQPYPFYYLILVYAVYSAVTCFLIPFINRCNLRRSMAWGFFLYALSVAVLAFHIQYYSFFLYSVLIGITNAFLWIPLNYFYFNTSSKQTNAVDSTIYMSLTPILSIIVPFLGVLIINSGGFLVLFLFAAFLYSISGVLAVRLLPSEELPSSSFLQLLHSFKGLKTITMIEGALFFLSCAIIPVYALLFFHTTLEFGGFLSYLGLLALVVSLVISHFSDRSQKRVRLIFILLWILALSLLSLIFATTTLTWIILSSALVIIINLSAPLRLAISMDVKRVDLGFWRVREFFLTLGRVIFMTISVILFYFQLYWGVFLMFALLAFIYPLLVKRKLKELN